MSTSRDTELILQLQSDSAAAFDALYWRYHQAIYANILKLVKNEEVAKDLLQDVFISFWEKRNTLDPDRPAAAWLIVVSFNRSVNYLKKTLKETSLTLLSGEAENIENPETLDTTEIQAKLLSDAIATLSPQKRKVFELCKMQKKTYEQASQELNISKHTVKEYLSESVASIKNYIRTHPDYIICSIPMGLLIKNFF